MDILSQAKLYVLEQLWNIYNNYETYILDRIEKSVFFSYTQKLIDQGNIIYTCDGAKVVGYVEIWKINYEQFGRLVCGENVAATEEDVLTGKLAYVANTWIDPDYRSRFGNIRGVTKVLRQKYFEFTKGVDYHCGTANRKCAQLIKVFKASKIKGAKYERI